MAREVRHLRATLILDLEDAYARARGTRGLHPRPLGPLTYDFLGPVVAGTPQLVPDPPSLVTLRNSSGYDLFFGEVTRPNGTEGLVTEGNYALRISSPLGYYQPADREVVLPNPATPVLVELQPAHAYPFPTETLPGGRGPTLLRGTNLRADGRGVARTIVSVPGRPGVSTTDDTGQWVLALPDDQPTDTVTVRFQRADGSVEDVANVDVVGGRDTGLRQTALQGQTATTDGAPIAGATVAVSGRPATVTTGADGHWSFYFPFAQPAAAVTVTATLADGREQVLPAVQVQPRSTRTVPTFQF